MATDINSLVGKYGGTVKRPSPLQRVTQTPAPQDRPGTYRNGNVLDRIVGRIADFSVGAAKGAASTAIHATDLVKRGLDKVADITAGGQRTKNLTEDVPRAVYTPTNTSERAGFGAEQTAEFLAPVGSVGRAEKAINLLVDGSKLLTGTVAKATARVASKAVLEGVVNGGVRLAQTGDAKEAAKTGATFGVLKGVTAGAGEVLRAFNIPEYLYSKVFKTTAKDMLGELKTQGLQDFATKDPKRFAELQAAGVIKTGADGVVQINPTLAREALDHGLKGSIKNMASETVRQTVENEAAVQSLVKGSKTAISIPEKQYANVLKDMAKHYDDVGFGEVSTTARTFAKKLARGSLNAEDALSLRRFLDGLRVQSSYTTPVPKLSLGQSNLKALTDRLRGRLVAAIPELKAVMNDYRFNIDALEALAKEAARRGNREVVGLIDSVLFSGGMATGEPATAATITATRRVLNSPSSLTRLGNVIEKGGAPTNAGTAAKSAATRVLFGSEKK